MPSEEKLRERAERDHLVIEWCMDEQSRLKERVEELESLVKTYQGPDSRKVIQIAPVAVGPSIVLFALDNHGNIWVGPPGQSRWQSVPSPAANALDWPLSAADLAEKYKPEPDLPEPEGNGDMKRIIEP